MHFSLSRARAPTQHKPIESTKPKRFGLVIVDMLVEIEPLLTYPSFNRYQLARGIERMRKLISFAVENRIPIIFVIYPEVGSTPLPTLIDLAGSNAIVVGKNDYNAFSSPEFVSLIESFGITSPIVGGFNRACCVLKTVGGGIARSLQVLTTDEIMFGNIENDTKRHVFLARLYFKLRTNYFKSVDDLIHAVKLEMGIVDSTPE